VLRATREPSHGPSARAFARASAFACEAQRNLASFGSTALLASLFVACSARLASAPAPLHVAAVEAVGAFTTSAAAYDRDGGSSAAIGSSIVWIFGDTITPSGLRSATAAWSAPESPLRLREATDARGAPFQFFPFTAEEAAFNEAHAAPPACCADQSGCDPGAPYCHCGAGTDCARRVALWPGDPVATGPREGIAYFEKLVIGVAPYDFRHVGDGLVRFAEGDAVARRTSILGEAPALLFSAPEPNFLHAVPGRGAARSLLYVYGTIEHGDCTSDVVVSRVARDRAGERAAYEFWTSRAWSAALGEARPILKDIAGQLGSVMWDDYLGRYLSAFSDACTGGDELHVRSAPRPQGPWSEPAVVDLAPLGATPASYAGTLHPALGAGRTVYFSYYQPAPDFLGVVHLATLRLQ
jgi:hypothetical protein